MPINKSKQSKQVEESKEEVHSYLETTTTWKNETDQVIKFTLYPPGNVQHRRYRTLQVVFEPGEEMVIPSMHDPVIQHRDKNNSSVVIGGLAPQLTKVGFDNILHDSVDVKKQEKKAHLEKLAKISMQKRFLDEAIQMEMEDTKTKE